MRTYNWEEVVVNMTGMTMDSWERYCQGISKSASSFNVLRQYIINNKWNNSKEMIGD